MKRLAFVLACLLTLAVGSTAAYAGTMDGTGSGSSQGTNGVPSQSTPSQTQPVDGTTPRQPASVSVAITDSGFSPPTLTVPVGTTVKWFNQGSVAHSVARDGDEGPSSGGLQPGSATAFTYLHAGTFTYHCAFHPNMTGTVIVTGGSTTGTPVTPASSSQSPAPAQAPSTSGGSSSASSSSSSSSSGGSTVINNNNNNTNVNQNGANKPQTPPATPPAQPAPAPTQDNNPSSMPNTGAAGAVTTFTATALIGTGLGYVYFRRSRFNR